MGRSVFKVPFETPALKEDFTIDTKRLCKRKWRCVIFPNPNAPTGVYMPLDQVERDIKGTIRDVVVIVDEALCRFCRSFCKWNC